MIKKISVVIPTLQKNTTLLFNLLEKLSMDNGVDEIIVIDNSTKGLNYNCEKLKIITPKENIFVNPAWNLGVKEAKNDIVALLNDDIIITDSFCSDVANKMNPKMGCIGYSTYYVNEILDYNAEPKKEEVKLVEMSLRDLHWGIAIFFYKSSFYQIPDSLKIYFGDDWLLYMNEKNKKKNYCIQGQEIFHYGSLSSGSKEFNKVLDGEKKEYKKMTFNLLEKIFSFKKSYNGFRIILFGIRIAKRYKK